MSFSSKSPVLLALLVNCLLLGSLCYSSSLQNNPIQITGESTEYGCQSDSDCYFAFIYNAYCGTDPSTNDPGTYCICNDNYVSYGGKCLATVGSGCTVDSDCSSVPHSICADDGACICDPNTPHGWEEFEGRCVEPLGGFCYDDTFCQQNQQCRVDESGGGVCVCSDGYVAYHGGCEADTGIACNSNNDCNSKLANSMCSLEYDSDTEGICICKSGFIESNGLCVSDVSCPTLPQINNGGMLCSYNDIVINDVTFGDECTISCYPGFVLVGNSTVTCGDRDGDGVGDFGDLPTCQDAISTLCTGDVFGNIAYPGYCDCFITCNCDGTGSGNCCPLGLVFNPNNKMCDYPRNYSC